MTRWLHNKMLDYVFEFAKSEPEADPLRDPVGQPCTAAQHHVPAGDAGHLPEAQAGSARGHRMPASPEVMATFFAGGISEVCAAGSKRQKVLRGGHQKQLIDIMRTVHQVEKHTGTKKRMIQNLSGLTLKIRNSIQYERSPAASAAGFYLAKKLTPRKKSARILSIL